jgi:import inner membrane translocase subunit TIM50
MMQTVQRSFANGRRDKSTDPIKNQADSVKGSADKPNKEQPSLLTDDLLEKAGMDMSSAKREALQPDESNADEAAEQENETQRRERWKDTARKFSDKSSTDIRREKRSNVFYAIMLGAAVGGALYLARDWETEEERTKHSEIPAGYSPGAAFGRARARFGDIFQYFNEPVFEKLLPDPLPEPYGRPLTLVLSLDDLLVHSEWTREHGWRTAKRPGVDYFLGYLAQYYEIVIFSNKYQAYAEKTVAKLDPYRASISYALFREATRYRDGKVIKDLSSLNRDLSKVIVVDTESDAVSLQPTNAILMKPWNGKADDTDLVRLIPLLEWIASQPVKDVRPILKSFDGTDAPAEYARREAVARAKFEEEWHRSNKANSWASSFLGVKPPSQPAPMMPVDYIRQEGQKGYEAFQKYLAENGEKMLAEEKAREKEILNEQKFTLNKLVTEGMPSAEELAAIQARKEQEARDGAASASAAH